MVSCARTVNVDLCRFVGKILHLTDVSSDARWELYKTLKKYQNKLKYEYLVAIKDVVYDRKHDQLLVITEFCEVQVRPLVHVYPI